MLIENEFTVSTPIDELWAYLLDVERIAPCMPGAELTETVDDHTWKGKVNMKFGPVALAFAGTVEMTERDDEAHRAVLRAKGMEAKGKGAANAAVTSWLEPVGDGRTTVKMTADITLTGAAAQLSRGLMPEISKKLTQQFADCLESAINAEPRAAGPAGAAAPGTAATSPPASHPRAPSPPAPSSGAKPVGGFELGVSAIWSIVKAFFRRLFGGGKPAA
ncbi:MAG TPA: SRPBCC family protein [Actinomycetota bacterium]|nr:SRPBCC family protein [Actinomycetota bacterium]